MTYIDCRCVIDLSDTDSVNYTVEDERASPMHGEIHVMISFQSRHKCDIFMSNMVAANLQKCLRNKDDSPMADWQCYTLTLNEF